MQNPNKEFPERNDKIGHRKSVIKENFPKLKDTSCQTKRDL